MDIRIDFQNYLQDMGSKFQNASKILLEDGWHDVEPEMNLQWQWFSWEPINGAWTRTQLNESATLPANT